MRAGIILGSLGAALLLNLLPWRNVALVPDFVALVLAFWCIRQPRLVGIGAGWLLGLLMDVGNGVLLGQHALAYSLLAFAAITLSRRILWFPLWGQALHVLRCCCSRRSSRRWCAWRPAPNFPGWTLASGRSSAPRSGRWSAVLLLLPQRRPRRRRREPGDLNACAWPNSRTTSASCTTSSCASASPASPCWSPFALLFARFFYLQVVQHDTYATKAEDNRISIVPIVPNRGLILDRNGVVLAHNYSAYTLEIPRPR